MVTSRKPECGPSCRPGGGAPTCDSQRWAPGCCATGAWRWRTWRADALALLLGLSLALVSVAPAASAPVTVREGQTLTVAQLAHRLLGVAGDTIQEIDRPDWGPCPMRLGHCLIPHWPPPTPPPLRFTLYGHATSGGSTGLCAAQRVHLEFDEVGHVTRFDAETRYGAEAPLPAAAPPGHEDAEAARICAGARSTRAYFPAQDSSTAYRAALFTPQLHTAATAGATPPAWKQSCRWQNTEPCREGEASAVAARFDTARIRSITGGACTLSAQVYGYCDTITYDLDGGYAVVRLVSTSSQQRPLSLVSVDIDHEVPPN